MPVDSGRWWRICLTLIITLPIAFLIWKAVTSPLPQFPVVSNLTSNNASLSWYTVSPTKSCAWLIAKLKSTSLCPSETVSNHYLTFSDLEANTKYNVYIWAGPRPINVTSFITSDRTQTYSQFQVAGRVVSESAQPIAEIPVIATFQGAAVSAITNENGSFTLNLSSLPVLETDSISLSINAYPYQALIQTWPVSFSSTIPDLILVDQTNETLR